jgi:hypothetical protein
MKICRFNEFTPLNEKMGVALPAVCYAEPIHNLTISEFSKFLDSDSKKSNLKFEITSDNFSDCISNKESYKKFPVVSILLNLFLIKISDDKFVKLYPDKAKNNIPHTVGGAAYKFGHKNWKEYSKKTESIIEDLDFGIIIKLDVGITIPESYGKISDDITLSDDINETIWHELNHLYEYYGRLLSQKNIPLYKRAPRLSITFSDENKWGIPKEIFKTWSNFVFYFYLSEPYEISAQVQEASYFVMKYGFDKLFETTAWKYANDMSNFNSDDFIDKLESDIDEYISMNPEEKTALYSGVLSKPLKERLKSMWLSVYKKELALNKEESKIDIDRLEKNDCDYFIRYMSRRVNRGGNKLKRKLTKLYDFGTKN